MNESARETGTRKKEEKSIAHTVSERDRARETPKWNKTQSIVCCDRMVFKRVLSVLKTLLHHHRRRRQFMIANISINERSTNQTIIMAKRSAVCTLFYTLYSTASQSLCFRAHVFRMCCATVLVCTCCSRVGCYVVPRTACYRHQYHSVVYLLWIHIFRYE